jgi:NADPH:quinone reductase
MRLTSGRGVDLAVDGVGGETLLRTLDCVRAFGTVASIGQTGGQIPTFHVSELGPRRSLSLARPSVFAYASDENIYRDAARDLFEQVAAGLRIEIGSVFPLREAADAHRALETGKTTGSVILVT